MAVLGISALALYHLGITFLTNSPTNTVSTKFATPIAKWVYPWFEQNWRLFAPNPMSQNFTVEARVSTDCYSSVTPWYNLSQMDYDTIRTTRSRATPSRTSCAGPGPTATPRPTTTPTSAPPAAPT